MEMEDITQTGEEEEYLRKLLNAAGDSWILARRWSLSIVTLSRGFMKFRDQTFGLTPNHTSTHGISSFKSYQIIPPSHSHYIRFGLHQTHDIIAST